MKWLALGVFLTVVVALAVRWLWQESMLLVYLKSEDLDV